MRSFLRWQSTLQSCCQRFMLPIYLHHWNHTRRLIVPRESDSTFSWTLQSVFCRSCSRYKSRGNLRYNFKNTQKPCRSSKDEKLDGYFKALFLCVILIPIDEDWCNLAEEYHEKWHGGSTSHCCQTSYNHQSLIERIRVLK